MQFLNEIIVGLYGLCLLIIFIYTIIQSNLVWSYYRSKRRKSITPKGSELDHPLVTVQLPVYNERYVIERLINAVVQLDWPKDKLEIQVLDDSTDESVALISEAVQKYTEEGFNIHQVRREERKGFKAGALAYGNNIAKGEFIAVFDADFIPNPDFLQKTIPHFTDEKVGLVQARWGHINRDYSLMTRIQAYALNAHFTIEQRGRNAEGLFINFNGTAGIWRKVCIDEAGGWQHDTLTEDLDLSYRAQLKGWKFSYLEDVIAPAELPVVISAFKTQQYRWTKGSAETSRKHLPTVWKSDLSLREKIHATSHLLSGSVFISIFMMAILSIPLLYVKSVDASFAPIFYVFAFFSLGLVFWFILYFTANMNGESLGKRKGLKVTGMFPVFLSMSMGLSLHNSIAAIKGYMKLDSPFIRTPKFNITGRDQSWRNNKYLVKSMNPMAFLEALISIYFLSGIVLAFILDDFGLLPFHLMLAFGFGSMFYYSIQERMLKAG